MASAYDKKNLPSYLVTFHSAWSYGASLQAFATLKAMGALGKEFEILNYINPYAKHKGALDFLKEGSIKQAFAAFVKDVLFKRKALHQKAFSDFQNRLPRTEAVFTDSSQLDGVEADVMMSGSDQIWNPKITGGLDPVFFLDFGSCRKRISVASSLGSHHYSDKEADRVKGYLSRYDCISVREAHAQKEISEVAGISAFRCLDPTLLLDAEYWRKFSVKPNGFSGDEEYILVFNLAKRPDAEERLWSDFSKKMGLPLWRISNNTYRDAVFDKLLLGMTPEEFVWLIDHAQFVITDSFHGTAFSVGMNTPFAAFPPVFGNSARIVDLLDLVNMGNRLIGDNDDLDGLIEADFSEANLLLDDERRKCNDWIERALF